MASYRIKWLTPDEKREIVEDLELQIKSGIVDVEIAPYLRELNSFEGICTICSCSGHSARNKGYLIFKYAEHLADIVRSRILPALALNPYINYVTETYFKEPDGEVTCQPTIYFSRENMKPAMDEIVKELRLALSFRQQGK